MFSKAVLLAFLLGAGAAMFSSCLDEPTNAPQPDFKIRRLTTNSGYTANTFRSRRTGRCYLMIGYGLLQVDQRECEP